MPIPIGISRRARRELELGHADAAKQEFDRALNLLMESPYGGRTEPRIREHFDRLVDRISTYEVKALTEGDGFTEQRYAPATIDELLALSTTFEAPLRGAGASERDSVGSGDGRARHRHPAQSSGCSRTSRSSRAGSTTSSKRA